MIAFLTLNHAGLVFLQRMPYGTFALSILLVSGKGHGSAWFGRVDRSGGH
jgi:hypothetical protein